MEHNTRHQAPQPGGVYINVVYFNPWEKENVFALVCIIMTKSEKTVKYKSIGDRYTSDSARSWILKDTVYPKKYVHSFCFAVLCCGYTLTDFPISIRLTSLALWQTNDCPSASKATLMNMDKYFMWIHNERLHNHNKAKHNKTVCIFLVIYCNLTWQLHYYLPFIIDIHDISSWLEILLFLLLYLLTGFGDCVVCYMLPSL